MAEADDARAGKMGTQQRSPHVRATRVVDQRDRHARDLERLLHGQAGGDVPAVAVAGDPVERRERRELVEQPGGDHVAGVKDVVGARAGGEQRSRQRTRGAVARGGYLR